VSELCQKADRSDVSSLGGDASTPLVSIIIPNLNGEGLLPTCLAALQNQTYTSFEVVLVDNASLDKSVEVAQQTMPDLRIITLERNEGFAGACNRGAESVHATSAFILFLNSDVRLTSNCVAELVAYATSEPRAAVWQPKLMRADGRGWDSAGSFFTRTGFLWHDDFAEAPAGASEKPRNIFAAKGACFFVRRSAFDAVAGFDGSFFAYFEETDLCWRLQLAGWDVRYVPVCCAYHDVGATTSRHLRAASVDYLSFRNRTISIIKNSGVGTLIAVLPLHLAGCLATAMALTVRGRWRSGAAAIRGIAGALGDRETWAQKRRSTQALRARPDSLFLPLVTKHMTLPRAWKLLLAYLPRW
jgi:GT2 family glycosyltransferase